MLVWFVPMRWLMIGLIVSLAVLLLAAAGVARYIRIQHVRLRREPPPRSDARQGTDLEL
jgi:uncharacterized membrane protein